MSANADDWLGQFVPGVNDERDKSDVGISVMLGSELPEPARAPKKPPEKLVEFDVNTASGGEIVRFALTNMATASKNGDVRASESLIKHVEDQNEGDNSDLAGLTTHEMRVELRKLDDELVKLAESEKERHVELLKETVLREETDGRVSQQSVLRAGEHVSDGSGSRERHGQRSDDGGGGPSSGTGSFDDLGSVGDGTGDGSDVHSGGLRSTLGPGDLAARLRSDISDQGDA